MTTNHSHQSTSCAPSGYVDDSTECAICLEPFVEEEEVEEEGLSHPQQQTHRILTLSCGHKWHLSCLVDQLQTAQPVPGQRILFSGCQCAKCGRICEHVELDRWTRTTDAIREQVYALIQEQLQLEAPDLWKQSQQQLQQSSNKMLQEGLRNYAFYLCSHCKKPYFGGTIECADGLEPTTTNTSNGNPSSSVVEQRLCVACTPHSQLLCQNPLEHARFIIWKCRFCCQPATHVCYGNTHFCNDCHHRNTLRYKDHPPLTRPRHINPIPCPGQDSCPFPMPPSSPTSDGQNHPNHHHNGPTLMSEQVYGCAWCQSRTTSQDHHHRLQRPGSHNLLTNPSGAHQLMGWVQLNPRMSWKVEPLHAPLEDSAFPTESSTAVSTTTNSPTTTNFVSSYAPCVMQQTIDLEQILVLQSTPITNEELRFEVSARYMGRTDCPSVFRLQATILEDASQATTTQSQQSRPRRQGSVLMEQSTAILEAPPDYWERVELELPPVPATRARYVVVTVWGQDKRFWQGYYGSKVCDIQLRLLGTNAEIQKWFVREEGPGRHQQDRMVDGPPPPPPPAPRPSLVFLSLLRDGVLPVLVLLLLAWLVQ